MLIYKKTVTTRKEQAMTLRRLLYAFGIVCALPGALIAGIATVIFSGKPLFAKMILGILAAQGTAVVGLALVWLAQPTDKKGLKPHFSRNF